MDDKLRAEIDARVAAGQVTRVPSTPPDPVAERRNRVREMAATGAKVPAIAESEGVTAATIYNDLKVMGVQLPRGGPRSGDTVAEKKRATAARKVSALSDRRRFKQASVPMGDPSVTAPQEVQDEGRTMFPSRVFTPDGEELVLKDGAMNAKIGGDVLVGRLQGAYIATLTLEERATCPRSCKMWGGCYGNAMQWARRWNAGPELEDQLRTEISIACEKNELVLIRLHILGDFYSFDYVKFWAEMLDEHPGLHVFGFTAHLPESEIGGAVRILRGVYPDRFMIRHSGRSGRWGSVTIPFPTDRKQIGDIIICPEQLDAMNGSPQSRHCGNCAACWSTSNCIGFIEH